MTRADVLTAAALLTLGGLFLPAAIEANSEAANRAKCANNLRQLGLAAIQYGDDKRFLPHNNNILALDGDATTNHTPKVARALVWYAYHDNPEGWICPSSDDRALSISDKAVKENMRSWYWGRNYKKSSKTQSPWIQGDDPPLSQTTELSYGWTRKGMNRNVRSTAILGADRAVRDGKTSGALQGNHADGWNVLNADGTVRYWKVSDNRGAGDVGVFLSGTNRGQGYLAVRAQKAADVLKLKPKAAPKTPWAGFYTDGTVVIELAPKSWDPYRKKQTFRGALSRGEKFFAMWGTVHAAELRGSMEGARDMPITIQIGPQGLTISSEGLKRTLTKKPHPRPKLVAAYMAGMRGGLQPKVESVLSKGWLAHLRRGHGDAWFLFLFNEWNRLSPRHQARAERQLFRHRVVYEGGKPKLSRSR